MRRICSNDMKNTSDHGAMRIQFGSHPALWYRKTTHNSRLVFQITAHQASQSYPIKLLAQVQVNEQNLTGFSFYLYTASSPLRP